jgi:hypothetical protein
LQRRALSGKR